MPTITTFLALALAAFTIGIALPIPWPVSLPLEVILPRDATEPTKLPSNTTEPTSPFQTTNHPVKVESYIGGANATDLTTKGYIPTNAGKNPPFDAWSTPGRKLRNGDPEGDILRVAKCYCVDTPTTLTPPVFGIKYGHYYGFDYYNHHVNRSYAFNWNCLGGDMVKIPAAMNEAESIDGKLNHPGPICLAWTETKRKECWQTGDGNEFCYQVHHGKDTYYWNGQKRGDPKGARHMGEPELMDTCQDMCQQLPTIEEGVMMDAIEADHEHQMTLQYYHQVWNSIDLFTETADMCDGCKK